MPANATGAIRIRVKRRTSGSSRLLIGVVPDGTSRGAEGEMRRKFLDDVKAAGMRPGAVGDLVHDAVCNDRFWIFTDLRDGRPESKRRRHTSPPRTPTLDARCAPHRGPSRAPDNTDPSTSVGHSRWSRYELADRPVDPPQCAGSRVTDGPCRSAIIAGSGRRSARSLWVVVRRVELHRRHQTFVDADPSSPAPVVRAVTREMAPSP